MRESPARCRRLGRSATGAAVIYGRVGKLCPTFISGTEKRRFSVPLLIKLNTQLYIFCCTGRQSSQDNNWSKSVVILSGSLIGGNWYAYLLAGVWLAYARSVSGQ